MSGEYHAHDYWTRRLEGDFSLRGTGHIAYSEAYNRWLYRAKRRALRRALAGTPRGARALDVGSGVGWVVEELARRGARVEGCDIAEVAVERLRRRFPDVPFFRVAVGAEALPRPDRAYEVVTMLDVAYHVTDDDQWRAALGELARVLVPGGRLIVTDGLGARDRSPAPHVRFRSRAAWSTAAAAAGLRVVAVRPCFRWLSRDHAARGFARLPDRWRGPLEYGLELLVPRPAHQRCAVLVKGRR